MQCPAVGDGKRGLGGGITILTRTHRNLLGSGKRCRGLTETPGGGGGGQLGWPWCPAGTPQLLRAATVRKTAIGRPIMAMQFLSSVAAQHHPRPPVPPVCQKREIKGRGRGEGGHTAIVGGLIKRLVGAADDHCDLGDAACAGIPMRSEQRGVPSRCLESRRRRSSGTTEGDGNRGRDGRPVAGGALRGERRRPHCGRQPGEGRGGHKKQGREHGEYQTGFIRCQLAALASCNLMQL